jgi:hypothetical protein
MTWVGNRHGPTAAGRRVRIASRIFALGAALFVIRVAVACGGSSSDTESDSCKQRQGHCATGGLTATCTREEVAFVDTCLCCVPANLVMNLGDDDDDAASGEGDGATGTSDGAAGDGGGTDSAPAADSGSSDAGDASG